MWAEVDPPLRVAYVVKRFPRISETFIAQEILELESRGVEVVVLALGENDRPAAHGWLGELKARVVQFESASLADAWDSLHGRAARDDRRALGMQRALALAAEYGRDTGRRELCRAAFVARAVEQHRVDHVHAHFANDPALVALMAHHVTGTPFSFTAHAKDVYANGPAPGLWQRLARHASFIATVSDSNRRHISALVGPRSSAKVRRLYNGVDLEAIRPRANGRRPGEARLLCVARLVEKKGIDCLIAAAAVLRDRGVPFVCSIVGEGPEAARLRRLCEVYAVAERVEFVGAIPHEDVVARMHDADLCVLPCRLGANGDRDVLPMVLLEAMAAGVPCVSTSVGGVPEIIAHQQTGLVVPAEMPLALADAVVELVDNPECCARMGKAARRRAERLFDRRQNVAWLHRWFVEATGNSIARDSRRERVAQHAA